MGFDSSSSSPREAHPRPDECARTTRKKTLAVALSSIGLAFSLAYVLDVDESSSRSPTHFLVGLCVYDSFLTVAEVAYGALLADVTQDDAERAKLNGASALCAALGAATSYCGHAAWMIGADEFGAFSRRLALGCVAATVVASVALVSNLPPNRPEQQRKTSSSWRPFLTWKETTPVFRIYCVFYAAQQLDCHFEKSTLSSLVRDPLLVMASFALPWLLTYALAPRTARRGVDATIRDVLTSRVVWIGGALAFGITGQFDVADHAFVVNRISSELICRLCPLLVARLVDEASERGVQKPASLVATAAVLGRATQSLGRRSALRPFERSSIERASCSFPSCA